MTISDTPLGPPAKKRMTSTPLNDPTVRKRTRPVKPGLWHPRIAESTPTSTAVSMGQPRPDVDGASLFTAAAISMGQPRPDVDEPPTTTATTTIYKGNEGLPLGAPTLLLNSAHSLNRTNSKTVVDGLHAESWKPTLRVCSVRAHIDLDADEAHQLLLTLKDLTTADRLFLSDRAAAIKGEVSGTPVFNLLMRGPSETRVVLGMSSMERLAKLHNLLKVHLSRLEVVAAHAEMDRRFPLQVAGAQRLQFLPPFPADDG